MTRTCCWWVKTWQASALLLEYIEVLRRNGRVELGRGAVVKRG